MLMDERRQLMQMMHETVAGKHSTQNMQCEVAQVVNTAQGRERNLVNSSNDASIPELLRFRNGNRRDAFIPKAKVKLNRHRHLWVISIAAPLPIPTATQCRDMICKSVIRISAGFVAN